jgi:hypothetical protein
VAVTGVHPLVLGCFPVSFVYAGCVQVFKGKAICGVVGPGQIGLLRVPHKYVQVKKPVICMLSSVNSAELYICCIYSGFRVTFMKVWDSHCFHSFFYFSIFNFVFLI